MNLICLDIEATDNGEMIELSIINHADCRTVYQSYFHPVTASSWPNSQTVHHITPAMVRDAPTVKKERRKIQTLVNAADGILGFAVDNDIRYLNSNSIPVREDIKVIDVRDWFWYYKGKHMDIEFGNVPRLAKCAELLGFEFSEETEAHSAANDTLMTIRLFDTLLKESGMELPLDEAIARFDELFDVERRLYAERMAHGFISLVRTPKGYVLRNTHQNPAGDAEHSIEVKGRYQAEHDLRERFRKRAVDDTNYLDLRRSDIDYFLSYANTYDAEKEEYYRHLVKARRKGKGGALSFKL